MGFKATPSSDLMKKGRTNICGSGFHVGRLFTLEIVSWHVLLLPGLKLCNFLRLFFCSVSHEMRIISSLSGESKWHSRWLSNADLLTSCLLLIIALWIASKFEADKAIAFFSLEMSHTETFSECFPQNLHSRKVKNCAF